MKTENLISDLFKYNTGYLMKHIIPMDKTKLFIRPNQRHNPIIWILGHIVVSRGSLLELLGESPKILDLHSIFASGTKPLADQSQYPHSDYLMELLSKFGAQLVSHINNGGAELLSQQVWGAYDNIGKYLINGYIHETYHVGQINYLMNLTGSLASSKNKLKFATKKKNSTGKILMDSLKSVLTVR